MTNRSATLTDAVWTGSTVINGTQYQVAVASIGGKLRPMFYGFGRWIQPADDSGYDILVAWALAEKAARGT